VKQHPNIDTPVPPPYDENKGMGQASKLYEQEHEASGNLPDSSDPVYDGPKPFRITHEG
jgi:hypothetical protein